MTRSSALALALSLLLAGSARAQEGGLRPTDAPPGGAAAGASDPVAPPMAPATPDTPVVEGAPKDPGGWGPSNGPGPAAGVPEAGPATPAPAAGGADPLSPGAAPAAPKPDPNVIQNDDPRANKIISNNYDQAIKIYEGVLNNDGESVDNLDHRIKTNENLVNDYKKRLAVANEQKRRLQVELFNRTFYLKQQKDKGAIPEDTYSKLMKQEEKKYADRSQQARSDSEFYEKEIGEAEKRLADLRAQRRVNVVSTNASKAAKGTLGKKPAKPIDPATKRVLTLTERLKALSAFQTKHTMDGAPVCEQCMRAHGPGAGHGGEAAGADAPPPPTGG